MRPPVAAEWRGSSTLFITKQSRGEKRDLREAKGHDALPAETQHHAHLRRGRDPLPVTAAEGKSHFRLDKSRRPASMASSKPRSAETEAPASRDAPNLRSGSSRQGPAPTTWACEAGGSGARRAGAGGVTPRGAGRRGGGALRGRGRPAPSPSLSPFAFALRAAT